MTVLADALQFAGIPERISEPAKERFVTVKLNGRGAVPRIIGSGKTPVSFTGYRVRAGQFIYSRIDARNGAFAIVPAALDGAVVSKDFPVFDVRRDAAESGYLRHFFLSGRLEGLIRSRSRGATNRQRIKEDELLGFELQLPPLPEQRRIAAILDHADALRAKRRQVLAHLDSITQSIFHDMFAVGGPRMTLGEVGTWRSGGTPPRSEAQHFEGEVPWFSSGELGQMYVADSIEHVSERAIATTSVKAIPANSLLVGMYDTAALKSSITTRDSSCNQAIAFATFDENLISTAFVYWAIQAVRSEVLALRRGIRQKNLNLTMVRAIEIPRVSWDIQAAFAERVEAVNAQRTAVLAAKAADDELFASLQARAFPGEL